MSDTTCKRCGSKLGGRWGTRCYTCNPGGLQRNGTWGECRVCAKPVYIQPNQAVRGEGRFCSVACHNDFKRGRELKPGTRYTSGTDGYVRVKTGIRTFALEHRVVMEQVLGRSLLPNEQVNHINHIRSDNRPENLEVLDIADHARESVRFGVLRRRKDRDELLALRLEVSEYRKRYGPLA